MTVQARFFAATAAAVLVFGPAAAGTEILDIKTGLWETTTTMVITGGPAAKMGPEPDYAKMPPQYREQMKKMRETMAGKPRIETEKTCITQEALEKDRLHDEDPDSACKRTVVEKTRTLLHMTMSCSRADGGKGEGEFRYEAVDREHLKGGFTMISTPKNGTGPMTVKSTMTGHWLGADCKGAD